MKSVGVTQMLKLDALSLSLTVYIYRIEEEDTELWPMVRAPQIPE